MPTLNRLHHSGSNADIQLDSDGWNVVVNVREPGHTELFLGVFLLPSLVIAKRLADRQLLKCGHSCSQSCTRWEVLGEVPRRSASGSRSTTQERRPLFASLRTAAGLLTPIPANSSTVWALIGHSFRGRILYQCNKPIQDLYLTH